ncbi:MAG: Gfo/Idh/MocA family oxidoreductase [Micrococcales bacterium]|nr:Gfo/Idh/MocA family oxidoreductase [Micrococcales bacterium]
MIKVAVVGLGKMGISHLAMIRAHPAVSVVAVIDPAGYVLDVLGKYTGLATYKDLTRALEDVDIDAVIVATPTRLHASIVRQAIDRGIAVFCEKPLTLSAVESEELAAYALDRGAVTQVGYHNRFVGAFREVKRLLETGAIGRVTHYHAEAYGPVVLRSRGATWRSQRAEGGGSLYDYAAHPLDLLAWYAGPAESVGGTVLGRIFSESTEDEVYATIRYPAGVHAQLSVNWSDESFRKMTTRMTVTGTAGRIYADRQEIQVYRRETAPAVDGYDAGWTVRYTTELTEPVRFYLRGEEYSAQLDAFVARVHEGAIRGLNDFSSAAVTDRTLELLTRDAAGEKVEGTAVIAPRRRGLRRRK